MLDDDSESVHELLVRGVAAAKEHQKDEARFFLEWVLTQPDASQEQQVEAWLWLSEVYDDPAKKRECLEQVLAFEPNHPLARRGLAILDGRLRPEDIIDPSRPAAPVAPSPAVPPGDVKRYQCPKCGARMAFDPNRRALSCGFCGYAQAEDGTRLAGGFLAEQDFFATLPTARGHRWELGTARVLTCQGCCAIFTLPPLQVTGACPFCSSPHVITATAGAELIEPEGILPFQFDAEAARGHVHRWLHAQRFRPGDLDEAAAVDTPRGVYLPFWTFDVAGEVAWRGYVVHSQGRYSAERTPVNGGCPVLHDDLLVPATRSLPADLLGEIADFDTAALAPYSPDLLADWPAEIYQIPLGDASLVARERALEQARHGIQTELDLDGSGEVHDLTYDPAGMAVTNFKLVLLPVWIAGYAYEGKRRPVAVNGQTGRVAGEVPRSGVQRVLAGLFGGD